MATKKRLIKLIGAEYDILRKSGSVSLLKFYIAAIAILVILLISACSIFYAMELLFHILHIELVLAIFVSLLFVFIYIFLLNTFSKNIFKPDKDQAKSWYRKIKLSDFIRTGFVVLMAFLISKPFEVFIFQNNLKEKVKTHRVEILREYSQKLDKLNSKDIRQLQSSIAFYQKQVINYPSPALLQQMVELSNRISVINNKQAAEIQQASSRVERSDFLLFRIKEVSRNALAWITCAGMICLFLLPGFLIYSISATDAYYKLKREYEVSMVLEEHRAFEDLYKDIFKQVYQLDRIYYTKFLDPPFNNRPKPKQVFQSQKDFFNKYSSV